MGERCAAWIRVSSGSQSEQAQLTEVISPYISRRRYEDSGILYRLHDVSAAKGEHSAHQEQVITDLEAGRYDVLIVPDSSRLERRDEGDELIVFLARVRLAGGRVEFVAEPELGKSDVAGKVLAVLAQHNNAEYVRKQQTHVSRGVRTVAANGAFMGSEPWGAVSTGPDRDRRLVHTDDARKYGPAILERITAGASLGDVARWLTAEGAAPGRGHGTPGNKWWAKSVAEVVRSKTLLGEYGCSYTATWTDEAGKHSETLRWVHRFGAVTDHDTWLTANKALDERGEKWHAGAARTGRKSVEPLSGASRCQHCSAGGTDSPMYKLTSGNLRCTGRGPQRAGCGTMLPVAVARDLADLAFGAMAGAMYRRFRLDRVPGNAARVAIERESLERREREVANSAVPRTERRAALAEIDAQLDALDATEITPDTVALVPTGQDYAQHWAALDADGRRGYLRSGEWSIRFGRADGTERCELDGWGIWLDSLDSDEDESEAA
jgi:hypothetical protein